MKRLGIILMLIAVSAVILAALSAIFIPMPWGAILAIIIGIGGGRLIYSFFNNLKL